MNGRLNDIGFIKDQCRKRILAIIPKEQKKGIIDRMLDGIEGFKGNRQNVEARLHIVGTSIAGAEGKNVAVAGTVPEETRNQIADKLNQSDGITAQSVGNILIDPEAVRKVKTADAVILVEAKDISSMSEIEQEIDLLKSMSVRLEGFIIT